ncbi:hypothetical protein Adt_03830 [Abeliophyllum distichum]|uniref:Transposase n=1 Tax=Abeliophyllum distichum TaxID=126358 RepID=A0ABD1VZV0_9LAMI
MQLIENNAKYFTRLVRNQVRFTVPSCYLSWTEVPEEQRGQLRSIIEERSSKNKANRAKAKYPSVQWSKSFSATRYDEDKLVELRETQHTQVASNGTSLDEHAIAKEVLGERRGHVRGVGRVPKGTSLSLDSTAASFAPQETSHELSRDSQNNDPRFAMYEAQLRQMQREIEILKNRIPVVVLAEEENGDEDEGSEGP